MQTFIGDESSTHDNPKGVEEDLRACLGLARAEVDRLSVELVTLDAASVQRESLIADLVMLVGRLATQLKHEKKDHPVATCAIEFLMRKKLIATVQSQTVTTPAENLASEKMGRTILSLLIDSVVINPGAQQSRKTA